MNHVAATPGGGTAGSESLRGWGTLDPNLLRKILGELWPSHQREPSRLMLQAVVRACGVCQHWRSVGEALYFGDSNWWQGQATIRHPKQLLTLCPLNQAPGGLMRGQVRRERSTSWGLAGRRQRLVLYQGIQSARGQVEVCGKSLLAAEQRANGAWAIFMDRKCRRRPVARLTCNSLRTTYTLTAASSGVGIARGLEGNGGSSGSNGGSSGDLQQYGSSSNLHSLTTTSSSSSDSAESNAPNPINKKQQRQQKLSRRLSWPHQCVMGCDDPACLPTEIDEVRLIDPGVTAAGDSAGVVVAAQPSAAAAVVASPQVLMSLQYKLHLKAMVLPRRMSVMLHVPQQAQQQCANNSSTPAATPAHTATITPGSPTSSGNSSGGGGGGSGLRCTSSVRQGSQAHLVSRPEAQQPVRQLSLENKQPHWNDALRVWCLNFNGRVRLSSAKNFQLISAAGDTPQQQQPYTAGVPTQPDDGAAVGPDAPAAAVIDGGGALVAADTTASASAAPAVLLGSSPGTGGVVVQFGKTDAESFILDWDPCVTTALQALAVACTTFGPKLLA